MRVETYSHPGRHVARSSERPIDDVCVIVEGAYPYVSGGVSAWVHGLIRRQPDAALQRRGDPAGAAGAARRNTTRCPISPHYTISISANPTATAAGDGRACSIRSSSTRRSTCSCSAGGLNELARIIRLLAPLVKARRTDGPARLHARLEPGLRSLRARDAARVVPALLLGVACVVRRAGGDAVVSAAARARLSHGVDRLCRAAGRARHGRDRAAGADHRARHLYQRAAHRDPAGGLDRRHGRQGLRHRRPAPRPARLLGGGVRELRQGLLPGLHRSHHAARRQPARADHARRRPRADEDHPQRRRLPGAQPPAAGGRRPTPPRSPSSAGSCRSRTSRPICRPSRY